jgi:hypothetical protein
MDGICLGRRMNFAAVAATAQPNKAYQSERYIKTVCLPSKHTIGFMVEQIA